MPKKDKNIPAMHGEIVIYTSDDKQAQLEVKLEQDTVWLSQKQMAGLFQKGVPAINEHIKNIYKERELDESSTIRKFRIVQFEGKRKVEREIDFYNLDVIISVGYRVKSKRGTQFRIWATKILGEHIVKGVTLNEKRLTEKQQELYPGIEEKAAHLLYFIIKDHPFIDGNKRIGSFLFILFLHKNNYLSKSTGEAKINDNTLVALALLIAESLPKEKEIMIALITNLLNEY